jgi:hypothetical protein
VEIMYGGFDLIDIVAIILPQVAVLFRRCNGGRLLQTARDYVRYSTRFRAGGFI